MGRPERPLHSHVPWRQCARLDKWVHKPFAQAAAQQLRKGAALLRDRLAKEDAFHADISQLQRGWNLHASADREDAFTVDLALRPHSGAQQPAAAVDLLKVSFVPCRMLAAWTGSLQLCWGETADAYCRLLVHHLLGGRAAMAQYSL